MIIYGNNEKPKYGSDKSLSDRLDALDGAGEIEQSMIENADTAGNILVANASKVFTDVTMSGDVTINSSGVTSIGANKVLAGMTKVATVTLKLRSELQVQQQPTPQIYSGVVLGACFTDASPDATATEITSVRFVPTLEH
jgi:hypothetical protein